MSNVPTTESTGSAPQAMVERLLRATNQHDLQAIVDCFSPTYRNETPVHPERGFEGQAQVRRNWEQILAAVPDITADLLTCCTDGDTVWTEWEHRGTRRDGSTHLMRGVVIFGVENQVAQWARFYLEPVQLGGPDADAAVRAQVRPVGGP
jgi:ketosteroid isomerase-like protein